MPWVERAAFIVPPSRSLRVRKRVSTPLMPGTPCSASQPERSRLARQFDTTGLRLRTTTAETCGAADS